MNLIGAPNVCRYVWIFEGIVGCMLNSAPCFCIVVILHSLFPHVTTTYPLLCLLFGVMFLSINIKHLHTVRWVFGSYCSSMMPYLWGLQLFHADLVQITFGLLSCLFCGSLSLFVPVLSSNLGILCLIPLHCPAVGPCLYEFCYCWCHHYAHYYCTVSYMCPGSCTCVHMDHKKCHNATAFCCVSVP